MPVKDSKESAMMFKASHCANKLKKITLNNRQSLIVDFVYDSVSVSYLVIYIHVLKVNVY